MMPRPNAQPLPSRPVTAVVPQRYPMVPMLTILGTLTAIMAANTIVASL